MCLLTVRAVFARDIEEDDAAPYQARTHRHTNTPRHKWNHLGAQAERALLMFDAQAVKRLS